MRPPRRWLALCVLGCTGCIAIVGFDDFDPNAPAAIVTDAAPPSDAGPADFLLSVSPARASLHRGETVHASLAVAAVDGGAPSAVITAADLPPGVTTNAVGRALAAGTPLDVEISAATTAPLASGDLTFHATSASVERTASTAIRVQGAPGTLDETFGDGGIARIVLPGSFLGKELAVWPDDKILVVGAITDDDGGTVVGLARYLADGAPDPTFRSVGAATESFGADYGGAVAAAPLPTGGLVVAGNDAIDTTTYVARIRADGVLDDTFGGGVVKVAGVEPHSVLIDGSQIVVVGVGNVQLSARAIRLSESGAGDPTFGDSGVFDDTPQRRGVGRAALGDGGRVAVAVETSQDNPGHCAVLEIPRAGTSVPDPPAFGDVFCSPLALAIDPLGRRGLTGFHTIPFSLSIPPTLVIGLVQPDGAVDAIDGGVEDTFVSGARGTSITFDESGRMLVAGTIGTQALLARLLPNGSFDTAFAAGGRVTLAAGGSLSTFGVAVQTDGRILLGVSSGDPLKTIVARYWP